MEASASATNELHRNTVATRELCASVLRELAMPVDAALYIPVGGGGEALRQTQAHGSAKLMGRCSRCSDGVPRPRS